MQAAIPERREWCRPPVDDRTALALAAAVCDLRRGRVRLRLGSAPVEIALQLAISDAPRRVRGARPASS